MTQFNPKTGSRRANSRSSALKPSSYDEMEWATYQEHRYQARLSYILSCVAIAASIGMSLSAGFLILSDNATQANIIAVTGLISTGLYIPLSRDANRKIERLTKLTKHYRLLRLSNGA
jgi:ABC-type transport system involved in cytochrome bd biosynthesis fused ATPase/permease subunit